MTETDAIKSWDVRCDDGTQYRARYGRYVTWASANGTFGCSCPSFYYRAVACKHVLDLVISMTDLNPKDFVAPVSLGAINGLVQDDTAAIEAGLPKKTITGLFGKPGAGKTTLSLQLAMDYMATNNRPAIIVDTEGSLHTYVGWFNKFKSRFDMPKAELVTGQYVSTLQGKKRTWKMEGIPKKVADQSLVLIDCRNIRGILHMHGRGVNMKIKDNKLAFLQDPDSWDPDVYSSPLGRVVTDTTAGYLAYDSLSMPMKEIGIENQNLPQRAEVTSFWMAPAQQMFHELDLCGVATLHYMKDPANIYGPVEFEGGKAAGHTYKFVFQLDVAGRGAKETRRKISVWRHPTKGPYSQISYMQFTDVGLVDVDDPNSS